MLIHVIREREDSLIHVGTVPAWDITAAEALAEESAYPGDSAVYIVATRPYGHVGVIRYLSDSPVLPSVASRLRDLANMAEEEVSHG